MVVKWKHRTKGYGSEEVVSAETKIGVFRLTIHRHISYPPETWLASCTYLPFTQVEMESDNLEEVKVQTVAKIQVILQDALDSIIPR